MRSSGGVEKREGDLRARSWSESYPFKVAGCRTQSRAVSAVVPAASLPQMSGRD
jgi:hypothetical protein